MPFISIQRWTVFAWISIAFFSFFVLSSTCHFAHLSTEPCFGSLWYYGISRGIECLSPSTTSYHIICQYIHKQHFWCWHNEFFNKFSFFFLILSLFTFPSFSLSLFIYLRCCSSIYHTTHTHTHINQPTRLRCILKLLQRGDVSAEVLQKNLHYAARVLEALYIDETK